MLLFRLDSRSGVGVGGNGILSKVSNYYSVSPPPSIRTRLRTGAISSWASGTSRALRSVSCCSKHKTEETEKEIGRGKKKKRSDYSSPVKPFQSRFSPLLGCQETRLTAETKGPEDTEDLLLFSSPHHVASQKKKKKMEKKKCFRRSCMTPLKSALASNLV